MNITNLADGADSFTSNAFLVNDTVLIDTGADAVVLEALEDKGVETVIITHSHWDHVENLPIIVNRFDPTVYAFNPANLPVEAEPLNDGETLELDGVTFEVYHTPGHKDDSICLYNVEEQVLFSGDLLFPGGSFGRTDLDEGDRDLLSESIERIAELDVAAMYAGHDAPTTEQVNEQIRESLTDAKKHEAKY